MGECALCRQEIPTAKEIRQHRWWVLVVWSLSVLVAVLASSVITLGLADYLTIRAQLKVAQRHLAEWQKVQMVDALVEANQQFRKRAVPAAARKDVQGK